jgi:hypothetical protein
MLQAAYAQDSYQSFVNFTFPNTITQLVLITPEYAALLLNRHASSDSYKNRPLSKSRVAAYARDMAAGLFTLSPDAIVFDDLGRLRSGQHRLHACLKSATPFLSRVVVNITDAECVNLDTGRTRSAADVLAIDGVDNSKRRGAIASVLMCLERGDDRMGTYSNNERLDILKRYAPSLATVMDLSKSSKKLSIAPVSGALVFVHSRFPAKIKEFMVGYFEGTSLTADSPALILRESVMTIKSVAAQATRAATMIHTLGAAHAHVEARPLRKVSPIRSAVSENKSTIFFRQAEKAI